MDALTIQAMCRRASSAILDYADLQFPLIFISAYQIKPRHNCQAKELMLVPHPYTKQRNRTIYTSNHSIIMFIYTQNNKISIFSFILR